MDRVEVARVLDTIKRIMKNRGFQYSDLSKSMGVSLTTVKRLLTKDDISVQRICEIADWLGFSFQELVKCRLRMRLHIPIFQKSKKSI